MFKGLKRFLSNIQNSDEATKKRWLIGASTVSMILVIGLWLVYIQSTFEFKDQGIKNQESVVGFWQIFKNGLKIIGQSIKESIKNIISEITQKRTVTIE